MPKLIVSISGVRGIVGDGLGPREAVRFGEQTVDVSFLRAQAERSPAARPRESAAGSRT